MIVERLQYNGEINTRILFEEKKNRLLRLTLLLVISLLFANTLFANSFSGPGKPNIIFILVDDMGWNGLGSFGNKDVMTPNIDRLADQGMKFTRAYVAPECTPTRAEFLSGQYGARTGITQVHHQRVYPNAPLITPRVSGKLPDDNYTIANMLQDAGYATAISGKWHVGDAYRVAALKEEQDGKYFKAYGFDYAGDARESAWDKEDRDKAGMEITRDILDFIKRNRNRPFFAYLSYFSPHTPLSAPDSLIQKYVKRGYAKSTDRFGDASEKPTADYLAMIEYLDYAVGKLLDGLDQMKLAGQTMVVFMSDNGAMNRTGNTDLRGAKGTLYEGGVRVPMIVRWPGEVAAGSKSTTPVHIVDMYATFKAIAGGNIPGSKILDGIDLLPLLTQQGKPPQRPLFWHHPHYIHDYGKTPNSAVRKGDYKLIYYFGDYLNVQGFLPEQGKTYGILQPGKRVELFNIEEDPGERQDLSGERPEKAEELLNILKAWWKETDAPLPRKNPDADISAWDDHRRRK